MPMVANWPPMLLRLTHVVLPWYMAMMRPVLPCAHAWRERRSCSLLTVRLLQRDKDRVVVRQGKRTYRPNKKPRNWRARQLGLVEECLSIIRRWSSCGGLSHRYLL